MSELNEIFSAISNAIPLWLAIVASLIVGVLTGFVMYRLYRSAVTNGAHTEAQEILQEAKDALELRNLEEKERVQEIEAEMWAKEEKWMLETEERIEELQEIAQEKKQKVDNRYSQERQKTVSYEKEIEAGEKKLEELNSELQKVKTRTQEFSDQLVTKISEKIGLSREEAKENILQELYSEAEKRALITAQEIEEDAKEHTEQKAKQILSVALDRFARAYSAERGIAPVYFENAQQRKNLADPEGNNVKTLQDMLGVDIVIQDDMDMIGVAGFDPVRRELARRTLEKLLKEKKPVTADTIKRVIDNHKRELLGQIKRDGDNLAKELKLEGLHPEVRQVMGSLRYRYSFTQNQYFHCGEVGWLCGLLAAELRTVDIKKARRSGMLHDLGKAMDHELDGGHAVIGADFIQKRNEAPDVVHAVKAHHYDEQPSTDMAFLVIAADAISGARPGARRSTIESYNQKVTELENIARSFQGVTDCYILSGGREVRVLINGKKVDDNSALKLSRDIATRIENECSYPGQIKVVVVRETVATESTTKAHA